MNTQLLLGSYAPWLTAFLIVPVIFGLVGGGLLGWIRSRGDFNLKWTLIGGLCGILVSIFLAAIGAWLIDFYLNLIAS